jgi:cell division protein ZapE
LPPADFDKSRNRAIAGKTDAAFGRHFSWVKRHEMKTGHIKTGQGLTGHAALVQRYDGLVAQGALIGDPRQREVAAALDRLLDDLTQKRMAAKGSALGWLFAGKGKAEPVKGLYIHGSVGRGKTMLMDMFFELVPNQRKRRVHFHRFMADVHDRVTAHREALKAGRTKEADPVPPVARAIAEEARLLCFDEFAVTDIADAMILARLFSALFAEGVVLVATSNVAPEDLYRDGLNRGLFTPFIGILKTHARVIDLDSDTDYRRRQLDRLPVYVTPLGVQADAQMDAAWAAATRGKDEQPSRIELMGRHIDVPRAAGRAARFTFEELCEAPLGARDYLAIAERFDTVFLDRLPVLDQTRRSATKRLILLVDTLYDQRKRLVVSAEAMPDDLYAGRPGVTEAFEFARTASRLMEMQGAEWLDSAA